MKQNNQPKERHSSIFFITILAGVILGVVLLGLITAFFVVEKKPIESQIAIGDRVYEEPTSYFLEHYVGYGKKYARLPNHFCKTYTNSESTKFTNIYSYSCLAQGVEFSEIDLTKHVLPVDKITSAAINSIHIAYMTQGDSRHDECDFKVYKYNTYEKTTQEINVPEEIIVCGAIGTYIESISPSARYIRFEASGPASAYGAWLYDTKLERVDHESKHSKYHYFFPSISPENGGEKDEMVIYQGDCEDEKLSDIGTCSDRGIYVRNNTTGKSLELKQLKTQDANVCLASFAGFQRDYYDDTLRVWGDCLGFEVVINNFSEVIKPLDNEDVRISSSKMKHINKTFDFSFEYPSTLTKPSLINFEDIEIELPLHVGAVTSYDKISKQWWDECGADCYEGGPDYIDVYIYKNPKQLSPKDWIMDEKNKDHIYTNYDDHSQELEEISLGDIKAVKYSWYGLGGADVVVFSDAQNNLIYMLSAGYMGEDSSIRDDFKIVLDSFELLGTEDSFGGILQ